MQPKYSDGTKVRIRIRDARGQIVFRDLERYENMSGKVLSSKAIVAYVLQPVTYTEQLYDSLTTTLFAYTIELEEGNTLHDLSEYCLEEIQCSND